MTSRRPHGRAQDRDALFEQGVSLVGRAFAENLLAQTGDPDAIERRDSLAGEGLAWMNECIREGLIPPDFMLRERRTLWEMVVAQTGLED